MIMDFGKYTKLTIQDVKDIKKDNPTIKAAGHIQFDLLTSLDIDIASYGISKVSIDTAVSQSDLSFVSGYIQGIDREGICYEIRGFIEPNGSIKLEVY